MTRGTSLSVHRKTQAQHNIYGVDIQHKRATLPRQCEKFTGFTGGSIQLGVSLV